MRIPSLKLGTAAATLAVAILVGAVALISSPGPEFTVHDKAYYADPALVNFVRPGLVIKILSAEIAADGTMKARVKLTDPRGLPLDREGITTPGNVSVSLIAAVLPKGQTQYTAYTTRVQTSPITRVSATQASGQNNGTFQKVADGEYLYTFSIKAPAGIDRSATHTFGAYGSRNLTEFDMGTQYDDDVLNFVPDGSKPAEVRDVIRTASCNKCHDQLAFHGGSRRSMELCVLCHTPQTVDPDTGNTVDMPVMTHKIHRGKDLPSVVAGGEYKIIGNNQSINDYSHVGFPADVRRCEMCHEQGEAGGAQKHAFFKPNRAACGACHDNVNFASGEGHVNLPQVSDAQCATCHQPQGELEFDASIKGAHTIPEASLNRPGVNVNILKVENHSAGQRPTVTFTLRDDAGKGIPLEGMRVRPNGVRLIMAGPTRDYGYTSFGDDVLTRGYVSEEPANMGGTCAADGTCTYTFRRAIPANAKGTFSIGMEARRELILLPGTKKETHSEYSAINKVVHFSVDGSPVAARRQVVSVQKCNQCHAFLSLHGTNRNQIEQCVLCHNPSEHDKARRDVALDEKLKGSTPESVNFALMVHKIHTGSRMRAMGREYTVIGFGGTVHPYDHVGYPAFSPNGRVGDLRNCSMCHVNGSETVLPEGKNQVTDPRGLLNPVGPVTSACTSCHQSVAVASHALANTTKELGESCSVCHDAAGINKAHAR